MADPSEPKPNEIDADNLSRLLELELIQKRASWKQAGIGGYFALMRLNQTRPNQPSAANSSVPDR